MDKFNSSLFVSQYCVLCVWEGKLRAVDKSLKGRCSAKELAFTSQQCRGEAWRRMSINSLLQCQRVSAECWALLPVMCDLQQLLQRSISCRRDLRVTSPRSSWRHRDVTTWLWRCISATWRNYAEKLTASLESLLEVQSIIQCLTDSDWTDNCSFDSSRPNCGRSVCIYLACMSISEHVKITEMQSRGQAARNIGKVK